MKTIGYFAITLFIVLVCGCFTPPPLAPSSFRKNFDSGISFWQIYQDPNQYVGKHILIGGVIAENLGVSLVFPLMAVFFIPGFLLVLPLIRTIESSKSKR